MEINKLIEIVKRKITKEIVLQEINVEDKSFLHKNHKTDNPNKFHIKLKIKSEKLNNMSRVESNKVIFKLLENELKKYIHSLQILFF